MDGNRETVLCAFRGMSNRVVTTCYHSTFSPVYISFGRTL